MPRAKPGMPLAKLTAAELREQSRRCREEARGTADPLLKRMLAGRALELAQLAEAMDRDEDEKAPTTARKPASVRRKGESGG